MDLLSFSKIKYQSTVNNKQKGNKFLY